MNLVPTIIVHVVTTMEKERCSLATHLSITYSSNTYKQQNVLMKQATHDIYISLVATHTESNASSTIGIYPNASSFVPNQSIPDTEVVSSTAVRVKSNTFLMTCRILVCAPDGMQVEARPLLDNCSSASFISERLAQTLQLPRNYQKARISGVAGIHHHSASHHSALLFLLLRNLKSSLTLYSGPLVIFPLPQYR